jgi:hypothetical protein
VSLGGGSCGLLRGSGDDFLTDGYISYTFSPQDAESYYTILFEANPSVIRAFPHMGAFVVVNQPLIWTQPPLDFNGRPGWILDYSVGSGGSVVPQQILFPQSQGDWRRHVALAQLRLPLFFLNADRTLGVPIVNAAAGQMCLHGAREPPFGDKTTTKIRIGACTLDSSMRASMTYKSRRSGQAMRPPNSMSN